MKQFNVSLKLYIIVYQHFLQILTENLAFTEILAASSIRGDNRVILSDQTRENWYFASIRDQPGLFQEKMQETLYRV